MVIAADALGISWAYYGNTSTQGSLCRYITPYCLAGYHSNHAYLSYIRKKVMIKNTWQPLGERVCLNLLMPLLPWPEYITQHTLPYSIFHTSSMAPEWCNRKAFSISSRDHVFESRWCYQLPIPSVWELWYYSLSLSIRMILVSYGHLCGNRQTALSSDCVMVRKGLVAGFTCFRGSTC